MVMVLTIGSARIFQEMEDSVVDPELAPAPIFKTTLPGGQARAIHLQYRRTPGPGGEESTLALRLIIQYVPTLVKITALG
jgi:hypothetical protein